MNWFWTLVIGWRARSSRCNVIEWGLFLEIYFIRRKTPNPENKQKNIKSMLLQMCIKSYVVKATLLGFFFVLFFLHELYCNGLLFLINLLVVNMGILYFSKDLWPHLKISVICL